MSNEKLARYYGPSYRARAGLGAMLFDSPDSVPESVPESADKREYRPDPSFGAPAGAFADFFRAVLADDRRES